MIRLSARLLSASALSAALAFPALLAAQQPTGAFTLPGATPTPSPAPAGPADERSGVAIPPRVTPGPTASPVIQPLPSPAPSSAPATARPAAASPSATPSPAPQATASAAPDTASAPDPAPSASAADDPLALPPAETPTLSATPAPATSPTVGEPVDWRPFAAGGAGLLALFGGVMLWRRRRKPKVLRLAAPAPVADAPAAEADAPRIDLSLDITGATRSVMMFTLEYRLTIANRADRAVNDLSAAVQLACARASANAAAGNAASAGAAQGLARIERVGPHQARSITGQVQLPLSAIAPLRQGAAPLFIPLVHVTLEGEGLRAMTKSFVIGTPSSAGRVHPIPLDQQPGAVAGLVAQAIAIPPVSLGT